MEPKKILMNLQWTGERLVTELDSAYGTFEHLHRYALAIALCKNKRVLDIASGEGYGTSLISKEADFVVGVDISEEAVKHANEKYANNKIQFKCGNAAAIPIESASVDVVVSFETIEHITGQEEFLREIKRVLTPSGMLIISTPDKKIYTQRDPDNSFHVKELFTDEFALLIKKYFTFLKLYQQRNFVGSVISEVSSNSGVYSFFDGDFSNIANELQEQEFFNKPFFNIIVASNYEIPGSLVPAISLFSSYKAYEAERKNLLSQVDLNNQKLQLLMQSGSYKTYKWLINAVSLPARLLRRKNR